LAESSRISEIAVDYLEDLNEPQKQAVTHVDGPLLVLAGAGSGKTRVITRRVAHLVHVGVAPWNILAITFTNKASGELSRRVEQLGVGRGVTCCTFHSLCARLLREFAQKTGLKENYSIYDRDDQLRLTKQAADELNITSYRPAQMHATISNAKNELQTPNQFAQQAGGRYLQAVAEVYKKYQRALKENNALDFDDLLMRMAFLMRDEPEIRKALSNRYRYVLVDEYQDTNRAQYILAHGIAMEHENICVTGDPDQSIYAWRGANIRNILEFEADYPNATVIRLEENYRSRAPILEAASHLIRHNKQRKDKKLFTNRTGGSDVQVIYVESDRDEADLVADLVRRHVEDGGRYDDVAVFYRVNSLSRRLEERLLAGSTPYQVARGTEFYNRRVIKDILAYLRTIANPDDMLSCLRIINTPSRGIGQVTVGKLSDQAAATGRNLLEVCREPEACGLKGASAKAVRRFADMMASLIAAAGGKNVRELIEKVVSDSGLEEALAQDNEDNRQDRSNIDELITAAAEFDSSHPGGSLADYLQMISLVSDTDHFEGATGAVTLMTLHAAKGLEFPMVFMVGCEEGLLPFVRGDSGGRSPDAADLSDAQLEEERRLAFVGMTRAKEDLVLICARSRMIRGRTQSQSASSFLGELGRDGVHVIDRTAGMYESTFRKLQGRRSGGFYEEADLRRQIEGQALDAWAGEEEAAFPPEYQYLKPGCRVHHGTFGMGKVVSISGAWPETRVDVIFDQLGKKRLVLAKAPLEMVEN
jgi:DNA helicase-2/ATP-dependent DNA helicase PcrA